jgi:metal-dependent amidase/aminoacylase/carboxypeptidase family protein
LAPVSSRVEYTFKGESAHAAAQPWRGRSALDAVELMDVGWNFRREHLRLQQRSHSVIVNGGDQPNVVPPNASVWYYFRETDYPHIKELREIGDAMAKAAAMMTNTEVTSRILGAAWPQHMNKTVAETMYTNIQTIGLPKWDDADVTLAKGIQRELKQPQVGLATQSASCAAGSIPSRTWADRRTTSATCRGTCRPRRSAIRRIFRTCRAQLGQRHRDGDPIAHKGVTAGRRCRR